MSGDAHDHPLERLSAYLDDALAVEERAEIDRHLAACAACRDHLGALRRLAAAIADEAVPEVPQGLESRVLGHLDAASVVPFRSRLAIPATIAATVAAVGLLVMVAWKQQRLPVPASTTSATPARHESDDRIEAGADAKEKAALPEAPQAAPSPAQPPAPLAGAAGLARNETAQPEREAKRDSVAVAKVASAVPENEPAAAAPAASVARAALAPCEAGTVDAATEARWAIGDPAAAARALAPALLVAGGHVAPASEGAADALDVIVPVERFAAFAVAARAQGVEGLQDAPAAAPGTCVRQRVRIVAAAR